MKKNKVHSGRVRFLWVRLTCCWLDSVDRRRVIINVFMSMSVSACGRHRLIRLCWFGLRAAESVPRQARFLTLVDSKARSSVRTMELSQPHAMFSLTALSTRLVGGQ